MVSQGCPGHLRFHLQPVAEARVRGSRGTRQFIVRRQRLPSCVITGHMLSGTSVGHRGRRHGWGRGALRLGGWPRTPLGEPAARLCNQVPREGMAAEPESPKHLARWCGQEAWRGIAAGRTRPGNGELVGGEGVPSNIRDQAAARARLGLGVGGTPAPLHLCEQSNLHRGKLLTVWPCQAFFTFFVTTSSRTAITTPPLRPTVTAG